MIGVFLKFGILGFGGPTALIAMMETEMVQKRKWVTHDFFLDMLAAINLVPGPNAVEMAIYLGYVHAGVIGLILSGVFFLIPATLITLGIAFYYMRFGSLPQAQIILSILSPIIIAIIFVSGYRIGIVAIKSTKTIMIGIICFLFALFGINPLIIILMGGFLGLIIHFSPFIKNSSLLLISISQILIKNLVQGINNRLIELCLYFFRIGATIFGSGLVLFAYIHDDMVYRYGYLTQRQLIDAIAVGQITPGPVSSAVTFIGYILEGAPGAILFTIAYFLPSFFIIFLVGKILPKIRKNPIAQDILSGINSAVVALIFTVGITLLKSNYSDIISMLILLLCIILLIKYKIDPALLILGGLTFGIFRLIVP